MGPTVLGTEMTVVLATSLLISSAFRQKAMEAYTTPRIEKTNEGGSYKKVIRERPSDTGVVRSHEIEDGDELEAKLGIPADRIGEKFAEICDWREVCLPSRKEHGHTMRDFEDCMRVAVALNTYSTQLLVTNGT